MRYAPPRAMTRCVIVATFAAITGCREDAAFVVQPDVPTSHAARGTLDAPVRSYILDADTAVAPSFQIRSDGLGVYANSSTLSSIIQGSAGAWVLDSQSARNATRMLFLDFGQPVAGSGPNGGDPIAVPSGPYLVRVISKCNVYGNSMWTLAPGATMACPVHVAFSYGAFKYAVQMNPNPAGDPEGAPETQWANVTCLTPSSGTGPCTEWLFTPSATSVAPDGRVTYRNVARLIKYVTAKNTTTNVNQGDFYVSFAFRVTNP
jgi:hypothetical protein